MKLNIYNGKKIVKTYEVEVSDIMFGTMEDIAGIVDIDSFTDLTEETLMKAVTEIPKSGMDNLKNILRDVFPGLTNEELRNTKITEIIRCTMEILTYTIILLGSGTDPNSLSR